MCSRLFVGGLDENTTRTEIEREFERCGPIKDVWVAKNPPGFGFLVFEDERDAADALRKMNGAYIGRHRRNRIRVEFASGGSGSGVTARGEKCDACGKHGHLERNCRGGRSRSRDRGQQRRRRSNSFQKRRKSRSRSGSRRRKSRSASRSRSPKRRSYTPKRRSGSRSNSKSPPARSLSRSKSRSKTKSKSKSRSKSK